MASNEFYSAWMAQYDPIEARIFAGPDDPDGTAGAARVRNYTPPPIDRKLRSSSHPMRVKIAERAFFMWCAQGKPSGKALEHWLAAEKEILNPDGTPCR